MWVNKSFDLYTKERITINMEVEIKRILIWLLSDNQAARPIKNQSEKFKIKLRVRLSYTFLALNLQVKNIVYKLIKPYINLDPILTLKFSADMKWYCIPIGNSHCPGKSIIF